MHLKWLHYIKCVVFMMWCVIIGPLIRGFGSEDIKYTIDGKVDSLIFLLIAMFLNFIYKDLNISPWYQGS